MQRKLGELPKRAVDLVVGAFALVLASPALAAAALAILVTMGRPVLFHDRRSGRGGAPVDLLKFRTMRPLRPGERIPDDDAARITRVGRFLRSTSIDELPSLLNVLRGDLSLVGPRPLPVRYFDRFTVDQARRLEVRPGITGWAQVNGRNELKWDEKFALDTWYVDHRSLALDIRIIRMTASRLIGRDGIAHGDHTTMPEFLGSGSAGTDAEPDQ